MKEFYNLSNDVMFKEFFTNRRNLCSFLNELNKAINLFDFVVDEDDIEYEDTVDKSLDNKNVDFDVRFRILNHSTIVVFEMQNNNRNYDMGSRMSRYQATLLRDSLKRGNDYGSNRAISLWVFGYDDGNLMDLNNPTWYDKYVYKGENSGLVVDPNNKIVAIFLKHLELISIIELREYLSLFTIETGNKVLNTSLAKEGYKMLNDLNKDEIMKWKAFLEEERERDIITRINNGKGEGLAEGLAKGKEIGLEEGLAKGKEEGLAEGLGKGKKEGLAEGLAKGKEESSLAIAKNMIARGMDEVLISELTCLPLVEIEKLKN